MSTWRVQLIAVSLACLAGRGTVNAQQFDFPAAAAKDSVVLSRYMPRLSTQVLGAYRNGDRRAYLDNLFRIQFVAGKHAEATSTLDSLRALQGNSVQPEVRATNLLYSIVSSALQRAGPNRPDGTVAIQSLGAGSIGTAAPPSGSHTLVSR